MRRDSVVLLVLVGVCLAFVPLDSDAVQIVTNGPIGSSLTCDTYGHITNFTVGSVTHVTYCSYFLMVDGGAPVEVIQGGAFNDIADAAVFFEPGNFQAFQFSNVIESVNGDYAIGFGGNLRDHSRSNASHVSWEPTMQITNTSAAPITFEAMRYTQGAGSVVFSNTDTIHGSADDVAVFTTSGATYYDPFGLTTSRELGRNGALLAQINLGGAGFALNSNNMGPESAPGESAFITESSTIPPDGRIISNYTINVVAVGNAALGPLDISVNFAAIGVSLDGDPGGLVIGSELTGPPPGGVQNVQAPLANVSSVRRWGFATTITSNPGANGDITFTYDPVADGIANENTLQLATRSLLSDAWVQWNNVVRNPANNTITAVGITEAELSKQWILASTGDNALPVTLSGFSATWDDDLIRLQWQTMSETGNLGFNIFRRIGEQGTWNAIGWEASLNDVLFPRRYEFHDEAVRADDTCYYYLESVDLLGGRERSEVIMVQARASGISKASVPQTRVPQRTALLPAYPNPFNPETWFPYELATGSEVHFRIFNSYGQLIREMALEYQPRGSYVDKHHAAHWDGRDATGRSVASGVYFYQFQAGDFSATRKLLILK